MDKMRKEFESAYWQDGLPKYMIATKDALFVKNPDGEYKIPHVAGAWWAWQASRTSQCVELPLAFSDERATTYLTRVTKALDEAGVNYK